MTNNSSVFAKQYTLSKDRVWVRRDSKNEFGYTDGAWVERYLADTFTEISDLSSDSFDLEARMLDWNTEYHLTRKRKQLLEGLHYKKAARVLEIGCGCGAITRFLGETFDQVVAVEGSYERAKLARLRTNDLKTVEVVNDRFQNLGNGELFDAIFCIGVWEYSPSYVDGDHPFEAGLAAMKSLLKDDGYLVLAIENQFGLKYFANSREDHAGTFFEGIEGYPKTSSKFKTFGRQELKARLSQVHNNVELYYPFPDYKLPQALLSEQLFDRVNCGELIGGMCERDYAGQKAPFFDTKLAWHEVCKNGLAQEMSNSFLAVVGAKGKPDLGANLGVLYNTDRRPEYCTISHITEKDGKLWVDKRLRQSGSFNGSISVVPSKVEWSDGMSVAHSTYGRMHNKELSLEEALQDVAIWWNEVKKHAEQGTVPGQFIDLTWQNTILKEGKCSFFDQELHWDKRVKSDVLLFRATMLWLVKNKKRFPYHLRHPTLIGQLKQIFKALKVPYSKAILNDALSIEARLQSEISGQLPNDVRRKLMFLLKVPFLLFFLSVREELLTLMRRTKNVFRRLQGRT